MKESIVRHHRHVRAAIAVTLLALPLAAGCILTSGQFLVNFDLTDPLLVASPIQIARVDVDLNTIGAYNDHKEDLSDLVDLALVGEITNNSASVAVDVEFWMTPATTTHLSAAAVRGDPAAVPLWGPFALAPSETRRIGWDQSAGLFRGRAELLAQVKGDGQFTLYVLGPQAATQYNFSIAHGVLVLVIDAGV